MKTVRFGLIGYGAWGTQHAQAIAKTAGCELAAIAVRAPESRARAGRAHPGVPLHADYRDLLAGPELDVVDVVLPSDLHHEVGKAVLESGRHLLLEKPMALRLDHCDELVGLAHATGRVLAVGHEQRLSPLWGKLKELIEHGAIGEPLYLLIELWRKPYRPGSGSWRYQFDRVGNWALEEPIHFFDLARWYLAGAGEPLSVYARANSRQPVDARLQDNFSAVLDFPGGAYAIITQTLCAYEHHQVAKLTGTKGALWASWSGAQDRDLSPRTSLWWHDGQATVDIPLAARSGEVYELEAEIAAMAAAVRDGRPPPATGRSGRAAVALCLAAQRSADTGQVVALDPVLNP